MVHTLILGLDAYDPKVFEQLSDSGKLPNLTRYAESGGYARFEVANPPQSEVSWTSIATGLNPGGHGIFDFVHRDPKSYTPYLSLLPTTKGLGGTHFLPPHKAPTIFEEAARQGFPATMLWWPATFPARPELPVQTVPGLGTPDIHGRMGIGTLFCSETVSLGPQAKTSIVPLENVGRDRYAGSLAGPVRTGRGASRASSVPLTLELGEGDSARLQIDSLAIELAQGEWSGILDVVFNLGFLLKVRAVTRAILTQTRPDVRLYFLPLQLHPLSTPWRYGSPGSFVKHLWKQHGPFLTLGMPQDTIGLEDGCITDGQFLTLCESIFETRRHVLMGLLDGFHEGILAVVFDSLDRIQHIFWKKHSHVIEEWYARLDALVGEVVQRLAQLGGHEPRILVVSDHGIAAFDHKVHLNRWLVENGYLVKSENGGADELSAVDWSRSQAYALGLNSLFLNLAGREGQGCVPAHQSEELAANLRAKMLGWHGPDGRPVVQGLWRNRDAFGGSLAQYGPDMVVGYAPGYRASAETGLGKWKPEPIEPNHDRWNSDHCIDYRAVPGVLFSNQDLKDYSHPSYRDIPELAIGRAPSHQDVGPPPELGEEETKALEERLRSLGYL
jgi:predicted AlkP superfamily phosphohydrolase/phosphomutase